MSREDWRDRRSHQIGVSKKDPMSHRIIEKRRRDRMNNCLADLSKLIPAEYLKKGRGRIEKTEIIEMAIKHMKYLQTLTCTTVEPGDGVRPGGIINDKQFVNGAKVSVEPELSPQEHYKLGYQECVAETMRFLVERQGFFSTDPLCVKMISHLQKYYEKLTKGDKLVSNALEHLSPTDLEPKMNDYHSSSISEMSDRNAPNSVMAAVHSDDSCHENGSMNDSQLREMLVSPRLSTIYIPTVRPNVVRHPSPEPSSPQNDSTNDNHSSNGSLYKFKNNIRERFEHSNPDKGSPPMMVYGTKRRANSMEPLHSPSAHDHYPSVSRPVPIFALHSNGSFYVPLTIDSHLLSPFVADLNGDYDLHGFSPLLLHPVTISVNFNRPPVQSSPLLPSLSFASRLQNGPLLMVPECR